MQSVKQTCVAFLIATLLAPGLFLGITPPKQAEAQVADIIGNIVGAGVSYALCEYGEDIREFLGGMLGGVLGGIFGLDNNENPESNDSTQDSVPVNEVNTQLKQNLGKTRTTVESDLYKECVLDPVAWVLKAILINIVEQDILDWVNTGFEGGPVFLRDPLAFAKAIARDAFDEYLAESGIDQSLCSSYQTDLMHRVMEISTQSTFGGSGSARCTMDTDLYNDMISNGSVEDAGIFGALRLVEEGNNPYSAYFNVQADAAQRTSEIVGREMTLANYGEGYHSERCEYNGEWGVCTPGQLISKQVDDWLGGSLTQMENADEVSEVVSELVANLVLQIFGVSEDGLLGGAELDDDAANGLLYGTGYGEGDMCDEVDLSGATWVNTDIWDIKTMSEVMSVPATVSLTGLEAGGFYRLGETPDWPDLSPDTDFGCNEGNQCNVMEGVCYNHVTEGFICKTWDYGSTLNADGTSRDFVRNVDVSYPATTDRAHFIVYTEFSGLGAGNHRYVERTNLHFEPGQANGNNDTNHNGVPDTDEFLPLTENDCEPQAGGVPTGEIFHHYNPTSYASEGTPRGVNVHMCWDAPHMTSCTINGNSMPSENIDLDHSGNPRQFFVRYGEYGYGGTIVCTADDGQQYSWEVNGGTEMTHGGCWGT